MASTTTYPVLYLSDDMTEAELAEAREEIRTARELTENASHHP